MTPYDDDDSSDDPDEMTEGQLADWLAGNDTDGDFDDDDLDESD